MDETREEYRQVAYYGCVLCQSYHDEGTPLYEAHLWHQSKHGIQWRPVKVEPEAKRDAV